MKPERVPIKGPQGRDEEGNLTPPMPEPQEKYEGNDEHPDIVDGNFTQDPFSLKAPESDHTPNHVKGPKSGKTEYGKFSSGRFGL